MVFLIKNNLGDELKKVFDLSNTQIIIVAPFIKKTALEYLLKNIKPDIEIICVTRWRLDEISVGVSDIDIWPLLISYKAKLYLLNNLHAKYYRADKLAFIGSANVTNTALGWLNNYNVELLTNVKPLMNFEGELISLSREVDEDYYNYIKLLIQEIEPMQEFNVMLTTNNCCDLNNICDFWLPQFRSPNNLYNYYIEEKNKDNSTTQSYTSAMRDLCFLDIPLGLSRKLFEKSISVSLLQITIINRLDRFVSQPRRFGEITQWLIIQLGIEKKEAEYTWQTLMRWLIFFSNNRYKYSKPNHTEIFEKLN